jgi:class 3 adenylate cyclase
VEVGSPKFLVLWPGTPQEREFLFYEHIEIGRDQEGRGTGPGLLLIVDQTISRRHCLVTQTPDGRCYVRDLSRNGTRVDGRRLVPNVETELHEGQTLELGRDFEIEFVLASTADSDEWAESSVAARTEIVAENPVATILVGDIRDYTVLVRNAESELLQQSLGRVFELLTAEVEKHGGTIKEYQGDAIFAFWQTAQDPEQVARVCQAALTLDALSRRIAEARDVWTVPGAPFKMDWALATGPVAIHSFGGRVPTGLSVVGEAVVRAFRIEKYANDETGSILACLRTQQMASRHFRFRDLGRVTPKGFDVPEQVFALLGPADEAAVPDYGRGPIGKP